MFLGHKNKIYCLLEIIPTQMSPQVTTTLVVLKTIIYDVLISVTNYFITRTTTGVSLELQRPAVS